MPTVIHDITSILCDADGLACIDDGGCCLIIYVLVVLAELFCQGDVDLSPITKVVTVEQGIGDGHDITWFCLLLR